MAYYSRLVRGIYHECRNCEVGNNIEEHNLLRGKPKPVKGRNGKIKNPRLCKVCEDLRNEVRCVPGVPPPTIVVKKPKATSYYSKERPKIYHECPNCYLGNNIEAENLVEGQPRGAEVCKNCARLQEKGNRIFGLPRHSV